ncbi:MAG: DNA repair exonuclease [Halioglobus sp.]|nr:DNA repair exonuclease [Halioglobus sp.]
MPRILHTADWQIGRQYSRFAAEDAAVLSEARFAAIERIAELAVEHNCDAVLVAGDVFDAQTVSDRVIHRTFNAMQGFTGPWILLPGNHDAALVESVWTRARRLEAVPGNVVLALESGVIELAEQGMAVLAAPLVQRHTYDDLTAAFDALDTPESLLRIGLAHGSVQGVLAEDIDSANPVAEDRVQSARLDYLALGDWHGSKQINPRCWYSGTPEPERFRNNDAGNVLLVEIEARGAEPRVTTLPTARYQWLQWQRQLAVASDLDEFLRELEQVPADSVLDIALAGSINLADEERLERALAKAAGRLRSLQCDTSDLSIAPTDEDIAALGADGYLGEVVEDLRQRQSDDDKTARDALLILAGLLRDRETAGDVRQ